MNDGLDTKQLRDDERALDELLGKLDELIDVYEAANLAPVPRTDELEFLLSTENALLSWELVEQIQPSICGGPEKCRRDRCRRARRCAELERIGSMLAEARATVIRERARWERSGTLR